MKTVTISYKTASNKDKTSTFEIIERGAVSIQERRNMISAGWQLITQEDLDEDNDAMMVVHQMAQAANISGGFLYREI